MKPCEVPEHLLRAFLAAYHTEALRNPIDSARHALAAVLPLAVAEEREACAKVAATFNPWRSDWNPRIAAAIRTGGTANAG